MRGVAGGDRTVLGEHRLEGGQAFQCGVGAVAVVAVDHAVQDALLAGGLVLDEVLHAHRHDFVIEQARGLGAGGALLALQGVEVLGFAADVVAARDDLGGLAHGVVDAGVFELQARVDEVVLVDALQGQGDGLDAAGHHHVAAARGDLVGGDGDGLQARGAVAVQGHAGDVDPQAGEHRHVAADVVALGAFVGAGADHAVVHQRRVQVVAREQRVHAVGGHLVRPGHVELAAEGLGQAGPDAVDYHHFTHDAPRSDWDGSRDEHSSSQYSSTTIIHPAYAEPSSAQSFAKAFSRASLMVRSTLTRA
ncbi:hypothetical protein D9M68_599410 [compost metagenome]